MSTMEATQLKVKKAVDEMIDEVDRKHLRDMQRKMFLCSAKCCEDKAGGRDVVENCVDRCNAGMKRAQQYLETELANLQAQLSRCAMTCYDKLVQDFGPDASKYTVKEQEQFNQRLDKCVSKCADDHIQFIPKIRDRFANSI